jgi:hypothetical protein
MAGELAVPFLAGDAAGAKKAAGDAGPVADAVKDAWTAQPKACKENQTAPPSETAKSHLPEVMLVNSATEKTAPPPPPFENDSKRTRDAFMGLFKLEHGNLSGQMDKAEINRLIQRTDLTDDQAIALAVLRKNFDAIHALYPEGSGINLTTMVRLNELWMRKATGEGMPLTQKENALITDLQAWAKMYRKRLESCNRSLYATPDAKDSVVPDACNQGPIGNCHFVSAITSVAKTDPKSIVDMITDNHNGTYSVKFPGIDKPVQVNAPTNAELACYGTGSKHGTWSTVLQMAYGRYWTPDTANPAIEGAGGSLRSDGLRTMTGLGLTSTSTGRFTSWSTLEKGLELSNKYPTTACVWPEMAEYFGGKDPSTGFPGAHEYSVLGFVDNPSNPKASKVIIQNPHRSMRWPNGKVPDGVKDLGGGKVQMTLEKFNEIFLNFSSAVKPEK